MDYLREGIGLRGYGQRDPLIEYQREGYDMFSAMMDGIKEESVGLLFNLEVQVQENPIVEEGGEPGVASGGQVPPGAPTPGVSGAAPAPPEVPAQARAGGAHARAQGGTAASRRDGRVSGTQGQSPRRDGRSGGGAHARRPGGPAGAQNAPAGGQGAPAGGQDAPIPAGFGQRRPQRLQYQGPSVDGGTHVETSTGPAVNDDFAHVGRNDPCPCGSGRKFKRCHGDPRTRSGA